MSTEAVERLRARTTVIAELELIDAALAAERRAVVERIDDALDNVHLVRDSERREGYDTHQVRAILAAEADPVAAATPSVAPSSGTAMKGLAEIRERQTRWEKATRFGAPGKDKQDIGTLLLLLSETHTALLDTLSLLPPDRVPLLRDTTHAILDAEAK